MLNVLNKNDPLVFTHLIQTTEERRKTMKIIRLKEVISITGLAKSTIYAKMSSDDPANRFPKNLSLGGSASGWLESEVFDWINQRIEERNQKMNKEEGA